MATTGLLALIDDIATLLDDVAVMTKVAMKKTAGVLGDDLALNAEQVSGIRAERELPVVWAVAKGSFVNKLILVPSALAISAFLPWMITPLLMVGGIYLCFEGFEKCLHKFFPPKDGDNIAHVEKLRAVADENVDLVEYEKVKIKGAIRTDFILSAEIIVIALGTVKDATLMMQSLVVSAIALLVTISVYGLVAGIVKLDDIGLYLIDNTKVNGMKKNAGKFLLMFAPKLMKTLSVAGTIAMFLVGGGIVVHGLPFLHHALLDVEMFVAENWSIFELFIETVFVAIVGVIVGGLALTAVSFSQRVIGDNV